MLSFRPSLPHAYEPILTLVSLGAAIVITTLGFSVTAMRKTGPAIELGGAIVGAGIAIMHYMGMMAYQIGGRVEWDFTYYAASILLGVGFGALATSRVARPVTRFCKYGGAIALILAIVSMHFTGMAAITIIPDPMIQPSAALIPDNLLIIMVMAMMCLMLGLGASTYIIDLHSSHLAAERFRHLSLHDPLTALPNRVAFGEHLDDIIRRQKDDTARVAVLSFDLDRFKDVNDVHGHAAGDAVLRTISGRMAKVLGDGEYVARIGGDEFVALTSNFFMKSDAKAFAGAVGCRDRQARRMAGHDASGRDQRRHLAVSRQCPHAGRAFGAGGSCHVPRQGGRLEFHSLLRAFDGRCGPQPQRAGHGYAPGDRTQRIRTLLSISEQLSDAGRHRL